MKEIPRDSRSPFIISLDKVSWNLFLAITFLLLLDFSGDYALYFGGSLPGLLVQLNGYIRLSIAILLLAVIGLAFCRLFFFFNSNIWPRILSLGLALFLLVNIVWGFVGLLNGVPPIYVFGDTRNSLIYLAVCAFSATNSEFHVKRITLIAFLFALGPLLKVFTSVAYDVINNFPISGRYLVRSSSFILFPLLYFFSMLVHEESTKGRVLYSIGLALAFAVLMAANMRGLFLGGFIGFTFLFFSLIGRGARRRFIIFALSALTAGILSLELFFSHFAQRMLAWNAATLDGGVSYRQNQLVRLFERFQSSPLYGEGLGSYDMTYEGFRLEQTRPYLLELEYFNLVVKMGVIGFLFWGSSILLILYASRKTAILCETSKRQASILGLAATMVALLSASFTNTLYSSIVFHFLMCLLIICARPIKSEKSRPVRLYWKKETLGAS